MPSSGSWLCHTFFVPRFDGIEMYSFLGLATAKLPQPAWIILCARCYGLSCSGKLRFEYCIYLLVIRYWLPWQTLPIGKISVASVARLLNGCDHGGFPVVDNSIGGVFVGSILRGHLEEILLVSLLFSEFFSKYFTSTKSFSSKKTHKK